MTDEKKLSGTIEKIAKEIEALTALELSDLSSYLEEKFGVSGMMTTSVTQPAASTELSSAKEEKTSFTVVLTDAGAQKLAVIKAVREIQPNMGLIDAKKLVESAPKEVTTNVKKEEAENAKKKLETAGAKVELK